MEIQIATDENFETLIQQNSKAVVKFYAGWCGSCRLFKPKFKRIAKEDENQDIAFLDVNAEENPNTRQAVGVNNLPFFAVYQDGKIIDAVSTNKEEVLRELLSKIK